MYLLGKETYTSVKKIRKRKRKSSLSFRVVYLFSKGIIKTRNLDEDEETRRGTHRR